MRIAKSTVRVEFSSDENELETEKVRTTTGLELVHLAIPNSRPQRAKTKPNKKKQSLMRRPGFEPGSPAVWIYWEAEILTARLTALMLLSYPKFRFMMA